MNLKNLENKNKFSRTHFICDISSKLLGQYLVICGWIERVIKLKKLTFVVVCDNTGMLQVILKNQILNSTEVTKNSIIQVSGILQKSE